MKRTIGSVCRRVMRLVVMVICGAIVGMNVYLVNANQLVGNQLPMPFGYGMAVVMSGSMRPALSIDDLIIVRKTEELSVDDIVVFQDVSSLVVHRIVDIEGDTIITKGDANNIADKPVEVSQVKGKVIYALPMAGKIVNFLETPIGIALVIVFAIVLLEIPRRNEIKKDDEERQKIIDEIERLRKEVQ